MPPKKFSGKAVWAVSISVLAVVAVLIILFMAKGSSDKKETIVLPSAMDSAPSEVVASPEAEAEPETDFFSVTNENVLMALQSIKRPSSYHQTYVVAVGSDDVQSVRQVDLWVNGPYIHAETSYHNEVRYVISDGSSAYMWYQDHDAVIFVQLQDNLRLEDLLGLPDFDAFLSLTEDDVVDSDYLVMEDPLIQCIYVCAQADSGSTARYWVNLENGLLYQSDVLEQSNQVYSIHQSLYETLAPEDEAFAGCFVLPDGSSPFPTA